jgi:hypothetical protein
MARYQVINMNRYDATQSTMKTVEAESPIEAWAISEDLAMAEVADHGVDLVQNEEGTMWVQDNEENTVMVIQLT